MADKVSENVGGPFYVTDDCIACGLCVDSAESFFKFNETESYAFVHKQPENDDEKQVCTDALSSCPADAIHNDG